MSKAGGLALTVAIALPAAMPGASASQPTAPADEPAPDAHYADAWGRIYRVPCARAREAVRETLREHRIRLEGENADSGVSITRWVRAHRSRLPGLDEIELADGYRPSRVQFHLFTPPHVEPGRVYVGSMVEARKGRSERVYYNPEEVGRWFFSMLEQSLDARGAPLPRRAADRAALARRLGGGRPCDSLAQPLISSPLLGLEMPSVVRESKIEPLYPSGARRRLRQGQVGLLAVIHEDGSVADVEVIRSSGDPEFDTSASQTVSFWRYEPARREGCPVSVYFNVFVTYEIAYPERRTRPPRAEPPRVPDGAGQRP